MGSSGINNKAKVMEESARCGKMARKTAVQPALRLAEEYGFIVNAVLF